MWLILEGLWMCVDKEILVSSLWLQYFREGHSVFMGEAIQQGRMVRGETTPDTVT